MGRMGRGLKQLGRGAQGGKRKGARLPPVIQERLTEARKQFRAGEFGAASKAFGALATKADERGRHRMALQMALFASGAAAMADDRATALTWVANAARFGAPIQNQTAVGRRFGGLVARLRARDRADDADAIEEAAKAELGISKLPAPGEGARTVNRERRRMLPKACPTCAAPVDLDEVEFDEEGADCPECGGKLVR